MHGPGKRACKQQQLKDTQGRENSGPVAAMEPTQAQRHAYRVCTAAAAAAAARAAAPVASRIVPPLLPSLPPPLQPCTRDEPGPAAQHTDVVNADVAEAQ